jgi:glycosyltransferase involved in cell wall biosynthesis
MADFKLEILGNPLNSISRSDTSAISVVIPLYNAEKYIGDCLESLLAQTFQNFEVVVVDDCSTDNSVQIVESYMPKFQDRLSLLHTEKNSGSASAPRNKGLYFSRGEYIFFLDSDDFITNTALGEMYSIAKDFDTEVVYFERNFEMDDDNSNVRLVTHQKGNRVEKPTFESKDLRMRVNNLLEQDIWGTPWCKFVRRNFLIENEITFPNIFPCEDYFWTLSLLFFADKFLRVPSATYFWRQTEKSSIRGKETDEEKINLWLHPAIFGLKYLDEMLSRLEFFRNNAEYRHGILDFVIKKMFNMSFRASMSIPQFTIYNAIKDEFGKDLGEYDVLIPALCTALNTQQKITVMNQREFKKVIAKTDSRIAELERELKTLS